VLIASHLERAQGRTSVSLMYDPVVRSRKSIGNVSPNLLPSTGSYSSLIGHIPQRRYKQRASAFRMFVFSV
jgi:hypothetical protein